jgi:hypothetical protein
MSYIHIESGKYPLYEGDIRLDYPDMGEEFVLPEGYAEVQDTPESEKPAVVAGETVRQQNAPQLVDGSWVQSWEVIPIPEEIKIEYDEIKAKDEEELAAIEAKIAAESETPE